MLCTGQDHRLNNYNQVNDHSSYDNSSDIGCYNVSWTIVMKLAIGFG